MGADIDTSPFLIVGLGNPGPKYAANRHNVGFLFLDRLAAAYDIDVRRRRFRALVGEGSVGAHRVVLAKPLTFMNDSGRAVGPLTRWYKSPSARVLIIHDDLDLPLARIRVRRDGSSGGHNGLKSIIAELGTQGFPRLRVGIGRPSRGDPIDYVLDDFDSEQLPAIEAACQWVDDIARCFLEQGVREAMNTYNGRDLVPSDR